jgi:hypothetical protein
MSASTFIRNVVIPTGEKERLSIFNILEKIKELEVGREDDKRMSRRWIYDQVVEAHPNAGIIKCSGFNENAPVVDFVGLRIATASDVAKEVTVLLCVATGFEGSEIRKLLFFSQRLSIDDVNVESVYTGYSTSFRTRIANAEPTGSGSFPMYGMGKKIVPLLRALTLAFKGGIHQSLLRLNS